MSWLRQAVAVTGMNLRSLPERRGASAVAVLGVAAVVGVFAAVLSMAAGFQQTMNSAGSESVAVVMRAGSTAELNSGLSHEQAQIVIDAPGVARGEDDRPLASAELYVIVDLPKKGAGEDSSANVPLRGIQPDGLKVRENIRIAEGRMFEPGRAEIIVGRGARGQFVGLEPGDQVRFGQSEWQVVGVFEAGGGVSESELWTDVRVLQPAYRRGNSFQSVRLRLETPEALERLEAVLKADPRVDVDVERETDYYAAQSQGLATFIRSIGYPLSVLMAVGAVFGALNTMYSSVAARTREIATLRALGFGGSAVAVATLVESLLLALLGGLLGAVITYILFNGYTVSTLNGATFSQVVFAFAVTPALLMQGIVAALIIGLIGGLLPGIRAARLPVVKALREL
jgi:putative ABC transport system permease protein